jgi:Fe-S oxidoreductase
MRPGRRSSRPDEPARPHSAAGAAERTLARLQRARSLPVWRKPWAQGGQAAIAGDVKGDGRDIVLFGDTFNRYFERENLEAAERVLAAGGYRLHKVEPRDGGRPLCCGRTFLSAGLVDEARTRRGARSMRSRLMSPRARASSGSNPPAC